MVTGCILMVMPRSFSRSIESRCWSVITRLVIVLVFLFCGVFADWLAPFGMNQISPVNRLKPPSARFWFGTDHLGRDMFSRVLYGAQLSVIIGLSAASIATFISVALGIVSGYFGGKVDMIGACITITEERAKKVLFSAPYYTGGISALVRE